jgi:hypothetical protein
MSHIPKQLSSKHYRDHWVRAIDGPLFLDAGFTLEISTLAVRSHFLSEAQKVERIDSAKRLRAELLAAMRRNWKLFWTGNESWILWNMQRSGSCLAFDQELPVRVKQMIGVPTSMLTVFFNPNSFAVVDL